MRTLLCDADIPPTVVESIHALGIPIISIKDIPGAIQDDSKVIEISQTFDAIIVALDKDYTTSRPLFAAMVERNARVVILRPPKCQPNETREILAKLILDNHRQWQKLLDPEPGVISCNKYKNRLRKLKDFPWYSEK